MICPNCKAEYREGFELCADCQIPLVDSLPEEVQPDPDLELVTVFETGDPADVLVAKSVLDEAGIEFFPRGEGVQDIFGAGRLGAGFNTLAGPVSIQVRPEDAETARGLLLPLDEDVDLDLEDEDVADLGGEEDEETVE
jgi:hypothetical protein